MTRVEELEREMRHLRDQIACRKFIAGKCSRSSDQCPFSHDKTSMPLCRRVMHQKSFCRLGDAVCRFRHSVEGVMTIRQMKQWQTQWQRSQGDLSRRYETLKREMRAIKSEDHATQRENRRKGLFVVKGEGDGFYSRFYCNVLKKWQHERWQSRNIPAVKKSGGDGALIALSNVRMMCHSLVPIPDHRLLLIPGALINTAHSKQQSMETSTILEIDLRTRQWSTRFTEPEDDELEFSFLSQSTHFAYHIPEQHSVCVLSKYPDYLMSFNLSSDKWSVSALSVPDGIVGCFRNLSPRNAVLVRRNEPIHSRISAKEREIMEDGDIGYCYYIVVFNSSPEDNSNALIALSLHTMQWFPLPNGISEKNVPWGLKDSSIIYRKNLPLNCERIVLFGGENFVGTSSNSLYEYDLNVQQWEHVTCGGRSPLEKSYREQYAPQGRSLHGAVYCDSRDKMIISGGRNGERLLDDVWSFDFSTGKWAHAKVALSQPVYGHCMVMMENGCSILVHGQPPGRDHIEEGDSASASVFQTLSMPHMSQFPSFHALHAGEIKND